MLLKIKVRKKRQTPSPYSKTLLKTDCKKKGRQPQMQIIA
jgi:hypothetical protein